LLIVSPLCYCFAHESDHLRHCRVKNFTVGLPFVKSNVFENPQQERFFPDVFPYSLATGPNTVLVASHQAPWLLMPPSKRGAPFLRDLATLFSNSKLIFLAPRPNTLRFSRALPPMLYFMSNILCEPPTTSISFLLDLPSMSPRPVRPVVVPSFLRMKRSQRHPLPPILFFFPNFKPGSLTFLTAVFFQVQRDPRMRKVQF